MDSTYLLSHQQKIHLLPIRLLVEYSFKKYLWTFLKLMGTRRFLYTHKYLKNIYLINFLDTI